MEMKLDYKYLHKNYNIEDIQDYSQEYETVTCKFTGKEIPIFQAYSFNNEFVTESNDICKKCKMCNWSMRN